MIALLLGIWLVPLLVLVLGGILFMFLSTDHHECHCSHCGDPVSPLAHGLCDRCLERMSQRQSKHHDGEWMLLL